jgi:hypothetical protein
LHQWCSTPRTLSRRNRENAGDDGGPGSPEFVRLKVKKGIMNDLHEQ